MRSWHKRVYFIKKEKGAMVIGTKDLSLCKNVSEKRDVPLAPSQKTSSKETPPKTKDGAHTPQATLLLRVPNRGKKKRGSASGSIPLVLQKSQAFRGEIYQEKLPEGNPAATKLNTVHGNGADRNP